MKSSCSNLFLLTLPFLGLLGCSDKIADAPQVQGHFSSVEQTSLSHKLKITEVKLEREWCASGWEIGIYTWEGVLAGKGVWSTDSGTVITVYGADESTPLFHAGKYFDAKIWDNVNDKEYYADVNVTDGLAYWSANGLSEAKIDGYNVKEFRVQLAAGWNLISINIKPIKTMYKKLEGPDIIKMFAQMGSGRESNVFLVTNERGLFYVPSRGFNGIPFWNIAEGYSIQVKQPFECVWIGRQLKSYDSFPITRGWNKIAYYPSYPLSCDSRFFRAISRSSTNRDLVVIAKDVAGRFAIPHRQFSNMTPWHEGEGYQINVSADIASWSYPDSEDVPPQVNPLDTMTAFGPWTMPAITGRNMSVLLAEISGIPVVNGDAVAAFNRTDKLVGLGHVGAGRAGLAVWGDDQSTNPVEGLSYGESFTLRYWSATRDSIYQANVTLIEGEQFYYTQDGFSVVNATVVVP